MNRRKLTRTRLELAAIELDDALSIAKHCADNLDRISGSGTAGREVRKAIEELLNCYRSLLHPDDIHGERRTTGEAESS